MKKTTLLFLVSIYLVSLLCPSLALAAKNPTEKFFRGTVNILTAPLEIPKQTNAQFQRVRKITFHVSAAVFSGFVGGMGYGLARIVSGMWDILSFPFEIPANYEPMFKPDFVFDKDVKAK